MRARFAIAVLVTGLLGCGGFDNDPLRRGIVRGTLEEVTPESAVVIEGLPDFLARPDEKGRFELVDVPQGPVTLLVLATEVNAERLPVEVLGGQVTEVGSVGKSAGAVVVVRLEAPEKYSLAKATVAVKGLPRERSLRTGVTEVTIPPIGCFTFELSAPGLGAASQQLCVEGAARYGVNFMLTEPDGSMGREGCSISGCVDRFVCQGDGTCR
jgi:hypothetical protein